MHKWCSEPRQILNLKRHVCLIGEPKEEGKKRENQQLRFSKALVRDQRYKKYRGATKGANEYPVGKEAGQLNGTGFLLAFEL